MGERKFAFVPGEYYHIYNRGNSKQTIFLDFRDHMRFLRLLYVANSDSPFKLHFLNDPVVDFERGMQLVYIGAYCLMPNHFHILLTPAVENGVGKFMQKLTTAYSMYVNNKYERTGSLFEGKYKAEYVDSDQYLKYLFAYIHLNPVKLIDSSWKEEGIKNEEMTMQYLTTYRYSSFPDYISDGRKERIILNKDKFPAYFDSPASVEKEMFEWLTYNQQERPV